MLTGTIQFLHLTHVQIVLQTTEIEKVDIFNGDFPGENFAGLGFEPLASKEGVPEHGVHFSVYTGNQIWVLSLHRLACYCYAGPLMWAFHLFKSTKSNQANP